MTLLEIQSIAVNYGAVAGLKDVSLKVESGQIVSLIGANGAGKTTTLKAISGLLPLKRGNVKFLGKEISKNTVEARVASGIIQAPEGRGIFGNLTVQENLDLGTYLLKRPGHEMNKGLSKQQIQERTRADEEEVLKLFPRLKERLWQSAGTLSGGEQQMVAIARALMGRPKILLLDEPSLGLAPQVIETIFEIITMINREKKTAILLVEQNALLALEISHHAYVIETGTVVMQGRGEDLLNSDQVQKAYLGH